MNWSALVTVSLNILKGLLPLAIKATAPQEYIDSIIAAIEAVTKVHGSPVTKAQIDDLMVDGPFGG